MNLTQDDKETRDDAAQGIPYDSAWKEALDMSKAYGGAGHSLIFLS